MTNFSDKFFSVINCVVNIHLKKIPLLFSLPIIGWTLWFTKHVTDHTWFAVSSGVSTLAMVNNFPIVIRKLYGASHTYDDLTVKYYIERKLADHEDQIIVQKQYEGAFIIIATWVLSLSTFGLVYLQLFKFDELPYTWAQIWSILSGAVAGVNMCQGLILKTTLNLLVKKQRRKFDAMYNRQNILIELVKESSIDSSIIV